MRKTEPDSKYFGESLEKEVFPEKINKNHPKTMQIIYCVVSQGIDRSKIELQLETLNASHSNQSISRSYAWKLEPQIFVRREHDPLQELCKRNANDLGGSSIPKALANSLEM